MSNDITIQSLSDRIRKSVDAQDISIIREYVFSFYYGEEDFIVKNEAVERVLAVLASYLETEEAYVDPAWHKRMENLLDVVRNVDVEAEHIVFGLNFDEIKALITNHAEGIISRNFFESQLRKLCPIAVNWSRVINWGRVHLNQDRPTLTEHDGNSTPK